MPYVDIRYKNILSLNPVTGLRPKPLLTRGGLKLGAGVKPQFGRDAGDSARLTGLADIDATADLFIFASYSASDLTGEVEVATDVFGSGHEGLTARASLGYSFSSNNRQTIWRPSISTTYADQDFMDSFFTITPVQALASGLPVYASEAGFKDISLNMLTIYKLSDKWSVTGIMRYKKLIGDTADSPVVENDDQVFGGLFLGYTFN